MRLGDVLQVSVGVVSDLVDCVWSVVTRVGKPLGGPLARLVEPLGEPLARFIGGVEDVPPAGAARRAPAAGGGDEDGGGPRERVEAAKFWLGPATEPPGAAPLAADRETGALPRAYGIERAVLLPRDPWSLFAFWEVTPVTRIEALRALGKDAEGAAEVLRVHVLEGPATGTFDVELPPGTDRWHLEAGRPATGFRVEVGLRTRSGRFVALAASAPVWTPPSGPSADTAVRWMELDRDRGVTTPPLAAPPAPRPVVSPLAPWAPPAGARSSDVHTPPSRR